VISSAASLEQSLSQCKIYLLKYSHSDQESTFHMLQCGNDNIM